MKKLLAYISIYVDISLSALLLPFQVMVAPIMILLWLPRYLAAVTALIYFIFLNLGVTLSCLLALAFFVVITYSKQGGMYGKQFSLCASLAGVNLVVLSSSGIDFPKLILSNLINVGIYILIMRRESDSGYNTQTKKLW